jgi:polyisoprenoid-binding protein YceI
MKKLLITTAAFISLPFVAFSAPEKYEFDKSHTHVIFMIDHLGFSKTIGRFKEFDGDFTFDEKEPEKSTLNVEIKPRSVDTNVPVLDEKLLKEKFFNTEKFPKITFKSTKIVKTGENTGEIIGDMTMLGVTKPVTLKTTYNKSGIHPYTGDYISGFSAETVIKRSQWGMGEYVPAVGDDVKVIIEAEGINLDRKKANKIQK